MYGDEKYRRIRVASQEALVCLNDGFLSRRGPEHQPDQRDEPPPPPGNSWQSSGPNEDSPRQAPAPGYDNSAPSYGHGAPSGPWGQPSGGNSSMGSSFRPPPYQDNPSSYGSNPPTGYNGPDAYNHGNHSSNGGYDPNAGRNDQGGYGYGGPNDGANGPGGYQQGRQPSGFDSWAAPAGGGGPSKTTGAGTWSSTGYQKNEPTAMSEPRYSASTRRDNRPTVLVGHSLSFAKPTNSFGSNTSGGYNPNAGGGYNPNAGGGYNPNAGGGYNPNAGSGYNPNATSFGSNTGAGGFGSNAGGFNSSANRFSSGGGGMSSMGSSGYGGSSSSRPGFMENTSRMLGGMGQMGGGFASNSQGFNSPSTSKLSKRVEVLKKIGNEAREKWDRRNMDKSMASSLADHDELRAGPQVMDRGYYQPTPQQVGTGDASKYGAHTDHLPFMNHELTLGMSAQGLRAGHDR